ncbi:MAG: hypothetical protein ABI602_00270 [Candidatus Saccharibacteria bacterium]
MKLFTTVKQIARNAAFVATALALTLVGGNALTPAVAHAANLSFNTVTDCDANAVIRCGAVTTGQLISRYNNGDGSNSATSIHNIFSSFGISSSAIQSIGSTAVAGHVTKSGAVFIEGNSVAVASGAVTAGRQNISGSTTVTVNGTTFYKRPPSVSFQSNSLSAFVIMKNGVFQYAILAACGNPVVATPTRTPTPKLPSYTLNKLVAEKGSTTFTKNVDVTAGTHVIYRVTVASTGAAPVMNLVVSDKLPAHVSYVPGTLTRDGAAIAGTSFFSNGVTVSSLANGTTTVFQFEAIVGADDTTATCTPASLTNVSNTTATSLPGNTSSATVNEKCVTTPVCTDLDITQAGRQVTVSKFEFQANGATFVNAVVNWGDTTSTGALSDQTKVIGQQHTFDVSQVSPTISVAITFTQNGKTIVATGVNCQKPVVFPATPVTPPTTPVTPVATVLPNTGAGSVIGIFAATSAVGAVAYRWFLGRRLSREG